MCGFAGFHRPGGIPANAEGIVRAMADRLRHRGPDDSGAWVSPNLGVALGFRRLSILDLSEHGHQPMSSADGRFVLALNGEIYNHLELRADLARDGRMFRGHADTEVLVEAIAAWGLEKTLARSVGMFAVAVVDVQNRRLSLARDRLGEKPLFYGWNAGQFFFGSGLEAFRASPGFAPEVDRGALGLYLRMGYVPAPSCILAGFHKLLPGSVLTLPLDGSAAAGSEKVWRYWSVPKPGEQPVFGGSPEDYVDELEARLRGAIRFQMLADVPVGAFLSGGTDSSTVVSLMQAEASVPVRTFSIGFPDAEFDETHYAEGVAAHLGTEHTTWHCTDAEVPGLALEMARAYSEPFADNSTLPTLALARLTARKVTVALSGDGGDELLQAYQRYGDTLRRWQQLRRHPELTMGIRCGLGVASGLTRLLPPSALKRRYLCRLGRARNQWLAEHLPGFYRQRCSAVKTPDQFLRHPEPAPDFWNETGAGEKVTDDVAWLSYVDLHTYLPDHILTKVDRAAMAFSLETRIPLLDHRVVELTTAVPAGVNWRDGKAKWPLRQILGRRVPQHLVERPKRGFNTPMGSWLRGPLREWGEAQLAADRLWREGYFEPDDVRRSWTDHQQNKRQGGAVLWNVIVFQAWHEAYFSAGTAQV